jgi:2-oxoglutarate dehydrogenase E1 component
VIDDARAARQPGAVRRVLLCSGKVYYDVLDARDKRSAGDAPPDVAIVRLEQLYPWPDDLVADVVARYANAETIFWVQEEPANMGGWTFVRERVQDSLRPGQKLAYAGRAESASTAVGSLRIHRQQQAALVAAAFAGLP